MAVSSTGESGVAFHSAERGVSPTSRDAFEIAYCSCFHAGSIITALHAGKHPVVMPRLPEHGEHVDAHQLELAHELSTLGRIRVATDADSLSAAIREVLNEDSEATPRPGNDQMVKSVRKAVEELLSTGPD